MQQQWGMFYKWSAQCIYVILDKQKFLSSLPLSHYPMQTKILMGKKIFYRVSQADNIRYGQIYQSPPADTAHGSRSEVKRCQQFSHYG